MTEGLTSAQRAPKVPAGGHLPRTRLIERLDGTDRVVIIRAEGGAGKTILAAQWAHTHTEQRTVWVALDASVAQPRAFWLRVFGSLRLALPAQFGDLASDYASGLIPASEGMWLLASTLLADAQPVVLVLDDLHHAAPQTLDELVSLVQHVPHLRVVATTRTRTQFEEALTSAALNVHVITSGELAFTTEEIAAITNEVPFALDSAELATVGRITQGHTLATRLAVFLMRSLADEGRYRPSSEEVARGVEAAASDFIPRFDNPETEQIAMVLSLAPDINEALADDLGAPGSWKIVQTFEERGLGYMTVRRGQPLFVMHALVRSALRHKAEQTLTADRLTEVRAAAYQHLLDLSDPVDLLALLIDGGLDHLVFNHFARNFSEFSLHRGQELIDLLDQLSAERLRRQGELAIILATALSESSVITPPRARWLARTGIAELEKSSAEGMEGVLTSLAQLAGLRALRDYEAAMAAAEEVMERIRILDPDSAAGWYAGRLQVLVTAMFAHQMDRVHELAGVLEGDTHLGRRHHLDSLLAFACAAGGDLPAMQRHLDAIGDPNRPGWRGSYYAVGWHLASAMRAANDGEIHQAHQLLQPLFDQLTMLDLWPAVVWVRGLIRLVYGQVPLGLSELDDVDRDYRNHPISPRWAEQLRVLRAELLMATGDAAGAGADLTTAWSAEDPHPATRMARARLHLLLLRPQEALDELDQPTGARYSPGMHAQRLLLRAAAQHQLGSENLAADLAQRGLHDLTGLGLRWPLSLLPGGSLSVLARLAGGEAPSPLGRPFVSTHMVTAALTARETVVLQRLQTGHPLEEIARTLHVSLNTIKTQVRSIYRKLGVTTRSEAVRRATQLGLL